LCISLLQAQAPEKIRTLSAPLGIGLSAALPGAGQLYAGNKGMAALYLSLEAAFITGNIYFTTRGHQKVGEYEAYADLNWDVERWLENYNPLYDASTHSAVVYVDNRAYSPHILSGTSGYNAMMADIDDGYQSITIMKDYHFYENIGKYEQFKSGWNDWSAGGEEPGNPDEGIYPKYSENQYLYAGMRRTANQILKAGGYFGTAVFLNHIVSAIDAGFRIKKRNAGEEIVCTLYWSPIFSDGARTGLQTGISVTF